MRHYQLVALGLAFTLVGCQLPLNLPHAMTPSGQTPSGVSPDVTSADSQAPRMGTLRFAIRWPERDLPGFTAQVIPLSTETIEFKLSNPGNPDFTPITQTLRRDAGSDIATTTLHLPEGGGYKATVTAKDANGAEIAANTATNITVTWGKTSPVPITLDALFAPTIADLGAGHGTPGQTVTITGANLERGLQAPVVIFPSGAEATGTREANGTITATIPANAGSGQLKIKVDGVTSTSMAIFQQVMSLELSADGAELGGTRDGDGAIASWLGDTFPIGVVGKDTAHVLINNPALTGWANPNDGVGDISPNGTFTALELGRSSVTAQLGGVSGTREVVVAPPAGSIIRPAGNKQGITDHSLTKVGDRWLASWYVPADKLIYWQMFDANGAPVSVAFAAIGGGTEFERAVRVAAMPDGSSALLVYTGATLVDGKLRNVVFYQNLNPADGAPLGTLHHFPFPPELKTNYDSDKLVDVIVAGDLYVVSSMRFDGLEYSQWLRSIRYEGGDMVYKRYRYFAPDKSTPENDFQFYSPTEDAFAIAASGSHVIAARHFDRNGYTSLQLDPLDADLNPTGGVKAFVHEFNRIATVATNGQVVLTAALETRASGTTLKLYRYDATLEQIGLGTAIANLQIAGGDPVNWPLDLEWSKSADPADPGRFLLTYARKVAASVNGHVVYYNQAMVQAIKADGTLDGPAYPLAKDSQVPTLVPTAEGGMALWLDSARSLVMRRIKFR